MSTSQAPQPTDEPERKAPVGLTAKGKSRWLEIRARNAMIQAINNETWGGQLSRKQAAAFAEFMRRFKLDISEIDNLGGRPYRNGRYYLRKTAELVAQGRVEWCKPRHIGPDARLDELAKAGDEWAINERNDRLRECIRLGVPADAKVAYLVVVKMKELALPTEGVKWWSPGRKKRTRNGEVNADPVGDENPITSTETRAWRRAGRLYAAEIPELYESEQEMEFAAEAIGRVAVDEAEEAEGVVITPPLAITQGPARPIVPGEYGNENAANWAPDGGHKAGVAEPVRVVSTPATDAQRNEASRAAAEPDPYEPDFSHVPFPEDLDV